MYRSSSSVPSISAGVRSVRVANTMPGVNGTAVKNFMKAIDSRQFNARQFGYLLVNGRSDPEQSVILDAFMGIVEALADQYDAGVINDATMNGKRLVDTISLYGMRG